MIVDVRVVPRAKKTELAGTRPSTDPGRTELVIRVAAPPVEGAANDAVVAFLAERLHLPRRNVRIVSGETSRRKRVEISGATPEQIRDLQ